MRIIKILFLAIGFLAHSQENLNSVVVEYTEITDFGILSKTTSTLIANSNIASYERINIKYNNNEEGQVVMKHNDSSSKKDSNKEYYFSNSQDKNIHFIDESIGVTKVFRDSDVNINWVIDSKGSLETLLGFKCKTARGFFRGREYKVWFTTEIPLRYGPWKLHGLPGLILKVKDNSNQIEIYASQVKYSKEEKPRWFDVDKTEKIYDIKDYVLLLNKEEENYFKEVMKKVQSKMPRGAKITNVDVGYNNRNNRYETVYEWEKKD